MRASAKTLLPSKGMFLSIGTLGRNDVSSGRCLAHMKAGVGIRVLLLGVEGTSWNPRTVPQKGEHSTQVNMCPWEEEEITQVEDRPREEEHSLL